MDIKRSVCMLEAIGSGLKLSNENDKEKACIMAIKAFDTIEKIKDIIFNKHYSNAEECDYGNYYTCENALMIKDIEEVLEQLNKTLGE